MLAEQGADVAINFRSKGSRAEDIASQVRGLGRRALLAQADLTDANSVEAMARAVARTFGRLDILVLNASGGLEKGKPASYAMELNLTARGRMLEAALPPGPKGGGAVFGTSHLAHLSGGKPRYSGCARIT